MRARLPLVLSTVAALLFVPGTAHAGGAVLDFPKDSYRPGDVVVGQTWFGHGTVEGDFPALAADGPWFIYLSDVNAARPDTWPSVAEHAIRVGRLEFERVTSSTVWVRVEFKVPLVPSGDYYLEYCNPDCDRLGEFVGGWIRVVASPLENLISARLEAAEGHLSRLVAGEVEGTLGAVSTRLRQLEQFWIGDQEATELQDRIAALEAKAAGAPWWAALGALVGLLAGLIGFAAWRLFAGRRRRRELRSLLEDADVPAEVVPFELEPVD